MPVCFRLLESRVNNLHLQLQQLKQHTQELASQQSLTSLSEDIHWILLVAGRTISIAIHLHRHVLQGILLSMFEWVLCLVVINLLVNSLWSFLCR